MLMYLRHAIEAEPALENPQTFTADKLDEALYHGAVLRVRPKAMTVAVIIAGLLPILWGRSWLRSHEPHSRADDWRHDHRTIALTVHYSGRL